jgi:hypothetical protein
VIESRDKKTKDGINSDEIFVMNIKSCDRHDLIIDQGKNHGGSDRYEPQSTIP